MSFALPKISKEILPKAIPTKKQHSMSAAFSTYIV